MRGREEKKRKGRREEQYKDFTGYSGDILIKNFLLERPFNWEGESETKGRRDREVQWSI